MATTTTCKTATSTSTASTTTTTTTISTTTTTTRRRTTTRRTTRKKRKLATQERLKIFSLWTESDKKYGGLSFTSDDVGEVLAISGFSLLVYQLFLYPCFEKAAGPITSSRVAAIIGLPLLFCYPFMAKLSGLCLMLVVNSASIIKNICSITILTGMNILLNNAVPQHLRGVANGVSVTAISIFKSIAPAAAGALFSWAQKRQRAFFLPGDQMVFFILNLVLLVGLLLTFKPFLATPPVG